MAARESSYVHPPYKTKYKVETALTLRPVFRLPLRQTKTSFIHYYI